MFARVGVSPSSFGVLSFRLSAVFDLVGDACAILLTLASVGLRAPYGTFRPGSSPGPSPWPLLPGPARPGP
eukprot:3485772-Prymnesium_polylepis.3